MVNFEIDQFVWLSSTYVSLIIETFIFDANIPFWLGKIIKPPDDIASTSEEAQHFVRLCGTKRCFWMLEENIHHLSDEMFRNAAESNFILKTLVEVLDVGDLTDPKPKLTTKDFLINDELTKNCTAVWSPKDVSKFPFIREEELSKKFHRYGTLNRKINHAKVIKNIPRKNKLVEEESDPKSFPVLKLSKISDDHSKQNSITNQNDWNQQSDDPSVAPGEYMSFRSPRGSYLKLPRPTPKKTRFIGLGVMGQRIVKRLLNAGHDVSIFNRTREKC